MKKGVLFSVIFFFAVFVNQAFATNYVKPDVFKQWLESKKQLLIVDIQPEENFQEQHFKGSIMTGAFPVKTDEDRKSLDPAIKKAKESKSDVVIICPKGKNAANGAYEYMKSKGIPEARLFILEGGVAGWPYKEMFVKGN